MDADISFGHWLQKRRKALDLTRWELSQKIGCSASALRKIETDVRRPSNQLAEMLAVTLEIPPEERAAFIRIARGELSIDRMKSSAPVPDLSLLQQPQAFSSNLPIPSTPLIGRDVEMAALCQMLADPQCRLITLVGPGGIGKTRLAIETAIYQDKEQGCDVVFVLLAPVNSASLLVDAIADALQLKFQGASEPGTQLIDHLRTQKLLLVLDNFEHLLDAVDLLVEIIQFAAQVKILCTSREQLNMQSEWVFEVRGLSLPEAEVLFVNCARRVKTDFVETRENRIIITQICHLVEGMPLAIELAAAWVRILSLSEIEQEIHHNLDFLSTNMRNLPERHRSLRAVFDHSWRMLTKEERQALACLSVFRGGFTRESAEQVAGASLDLLSALVVKSLVQANEQKRFSLHELVRQYASTRLETTDEIEKAQFRHITFFTDFAERCKQHFGDSLIVTCLERMEEENDNLRAALDYAITSQTVQMALCLSAALWRFWEYRGHIVEGRRWLKVALDLPNIHTEDYALQRAMALNAAGALARVQGDFAEAHRLLEDSLTIRRKAGDLAGLADSLDSLGVLTMYEGQYAQAETYLQESLQICRELGNEAEAVKRLNDLAIVTLFQGEYKKARLLDEQVVAFHRQLNDRRGTGASLHNLAEVLYYEGQYDRAMLVLEECLAISHEIHEVQLTLATLGMMARVYTARGDSDHALATFYKSLIQNREVGNKVQIAMELEGIAEALNGHAGQSSAPDYEVRLAVRLLSAGSQLRATMGAPYSIPERAVIERITTQLTAQLPSNDFVLEWEHGASMPIEQVIEVALNHLSQISKAVDSAGQ